MKLSPLLLGLVFGTLLVGAACKSQANDAPGAGEGPEAAPTAPAPAGEPSADGATGSNATVTVESAEVKAGAAGTATVHFKPAAGYKWNLEYPARLTFSGTAAKVDLGKSAFHQLKGDFVASEKEAKVTIPVTAKSAGEETLTAEARYSVCNDTTCLIEKANVQVTVKVTP